MEIDFVRWDGDAYITVLVDSRGFSGRNDLHILASHFQDFCTNLVELQESLKGEARLVGVMDGELDVLIRPADALGHFSVIGSTGYHVGMAHTAYWHAVHFGFQIDPSQLDAAVKTSWIRKYAE